ncbi:MAG: Gfo/Idh/MocA family protein [Geminicoccaceae bacterium]
MKQRWGLIGFGRFGQLHAGSIERIASIELAAIATRGEASAAAARTAHPNAAVTTDWMALLDDPALDVVDIVAPNHLHADMAIRALEAGKNVLVEKPLATSIEDCDRLVETVDRTGRLLSVGLELRLSIQWGRIKQLIDIGRIGHPRQVHVSLFRHPYRDGAGGWRQKSGEVGSWILEEPVHFYDLVMWYLAALGDPVSVAAYGTAAVAPGMFDNFTSTLRFADGGLAVITQSLAGFGHHLVVEISGTSGAIRATWSAGDAGSETPSFGLFVGPIGMTPPEHLALAGQSGEVFELEEQMRQISEAFASGQVLVDVREGRKAALLCLEAERAVRENREIDLDFS